MINRHSKCDKTRLALADWETLEEWRSKCVCVTSFNEWNQDNANDSKKKEQSIDIMKTIEKTVSLTFCYHGIQGWIPLKKLEISNYLESSLTIANGSWWFKQNNCLRIIETYEQEEQKPKMANFNIFQS